MMGTIIARNEELERELKIITRALEIREESNRKSNDLEKLIGQLQNQLTLEKKMNHDF